jgi:tetratricopeptide (TPR) repeat protein
VKNYTAALRLRGPYDKPTLLGYRGFAYANLKRYPEALIDANEAIKLDANCCSGYLVRGMCYNSMGKLKEAKQSLDHAAVLAPNEAEGMRLEGELAAKTGDFEQATDYMQYAHQLDYHLFLGAKVPEIKLTEYVKTIKEYSALLQSDPKNKEALFNRAVLYLCVNEPRRATADLAKFLSLSNWQGAAAGQAALLMNIGYRQQGAAANAAHALQDCKDHVPEKDRSVEMKFLLGEMSENDALRAATDRSSQTMIRSYVGLDLECQGEKDKAIAQYAWIAHNGDETMDGFSLALSGLSRLKHGLKHVSPADLP